MGNATHKDDYSTREGTLLHRAVELLLEEEIDLEEFEIVGKFPTSEEMKKFKLKTDKISWVPTTHLSWWTDVQSQLESIK